VRALNTVLLAGDTDQTANDLVPTLLTATGLLAYVQSKNDRSQVLELRLVIPTRACFLLVRRAWRHAERL
jgi:hypothetical protein